MVLTKTVFVLISIVITGANECPNKCICKRVNQRDDSVYMKLKCGEVNNKISHLEELDLLNIASEIVHFNLSNNLLKSFALKVQLISLQKLDLSRNLLTELHNDQFASLPNLRRLDISNNYIKTIELLAFSQLNNLERLKLNQNQISTLGKGTFDPLINLKQLDISNNPLKCDCNLLWVLDWSQKKYIKLVSNPTCSAPSSSKVLLLRKLKLGEEIKCKSHSMNGGIPLLEMKPNVNQVVFEGDTLRLQCTAPSIFDTYDSPMSSKIEWTWLDSDPKLHFSDVTIENNLLQNKESIASTLQISRLQRNHTGIWNCLLFSLQGNYSKGITIVVISDDTEYCPITVSSSNKGTYTWPRTVVNYTATIPCESVNLNYDVSLQKASYFCSEKGRWENLNTSMCSYTSETTKILEQFSKVNSSILESAKHFRNYTSTQNHFRDVMDLVFAIQTMENYLKYLTIDHIGGVLMDVISNLLQLPKEYLRRANYLHRSCLKLVIITEKLAGISSTSFLHKSNIATEIFPVKKNGFSGLKCTWYVDMEKSFDRLFYCGTNSQPDTTDMDGKITEASVTVPETLFQQLEDQGHQLPDKIYNILISMHSTNKLFPIDESREHIYDVRTAVAGAKLVNFTVTNLTDPVFVMLKAPPSLFSAAPSLVPVWWNQQLNNGTGSWSSEGCHFRHEYDDHIVFFCHSLGYYGLLEDVSALESVRRGAKFKLSHPAIYVGSLILFTSLLVTVVTYLMCYNQIQMPKKAKHSLINLWIAICCLCFLYVFGIYQTEDVQICQIVGMLLHYFTLSSLLWMCVGVNCMYKRLSKTDVMELQDDELPSDQPIKKPIIGLYFVGWGVAIIVCGISAAINIKEYASPGYCFLRTGPPLSALYIPFAILAVFLTIFFLLIRCAIYGLDPNGHLSEGTQATENVDLDLLEPNFPTADDRSVLSASSSKTASSEVEDPEHAPSAQLKAYAIVLCLYVTTWLSCAFATVSAATAFEHDLFSVAYAILCAVLGAFTVFFYCVARSDVRGQWTVLGRWLGRKRWSCFRSRNVSDATHNVVVVPPPPPPPLLPVPSTVGVHSRSSSRSSSRTKSNSHNSNMLKGAADLNGGGPGEVLPPVKINNVNLIMLHRQQYRTSVIPNIIENPTSAAEVFYNPHQSIVARKFFRRQKRRHMMKRNNLVPTTRQRDSDSASVLSEFKKKRVDDVDIFGTNSKVNNTNIHVEHHRKQRHKNPNIFSDSADDCDDSVLKNVGAAAAAAYDAERRKKEAAAASKHRSKKRQNASHDRSENNMRTVSQQCTLDYSSENVSDSILDKASPDKCPDGAVDDEILCTVKFDLAAEATPTSKERDCEAGSSVPVVPRIYVNPSHDDHHHQQQQQKASVGQSRTSSVSVSDLDELYQQIRRGPKSLVSCPPRSTLNNFSLTRNSSCLSDSDINSYVTYDNTYRQKTYSNGCLSDNVETTV